MKKILIISYFYPPCNLTAAQRPGSWYKYLPEFGFLPIVVTRNWTGKELSEEERLNSSGQNATIIKNKDGEVHYLPYSASLRDISFIRSHTNIFYGLLSKSLTALNLFLHNYFIRFIPYNNLYFHSRQVLQDNPDISFLIISGNPFEQFFFGHLLKKEFPYIKWIADFRDEWTTSEIIEFGFFKKWLWQFQRFSEIKWVKNASLITGNTNHAVSKLAAFHKKPTKKLLNGFDFVSAPSQIVSSPNSLKIVHNGTLYPTQDISVFIQGIKLVHIPDDFSLEVFFPGIKIMPNVAQIVEESFKGSNIKLFLSNRLQQKEVMELQANADLLLMVAHKNRKGIVGSKLYEYIGLQKNILLCPTDNDELEDTISESNLGIVASDTQSVKQVIERLIELKRSDASIAKEPNVEAINKYTRKSQVQLLASYLNEL